MTPAHKLVQFLDEQGLLFRYFTINIENTESRFLDSEKLVQLYGAPSLVSS